MAETIAYLIEVKGGPEGAKQIRMVEQAAKGAGAQIKQVGDHSRESSKHVGSLEGVLKKAAIALGAMGAGYVAWNAAKNAISYTGELAKKTDTFTKVTHMSVQQSSTWISVANALGVESTKLGMLFTKTASAAEAQANKTGHSVTAFDKLGISTAEAKAKMNDMPGMIDLILEKLNDPRLDAVTKTKLQLELFGRGWQNLAPILNEGAGGMEKWRKMAEKFGTVLGPESTDKLLKLHEASIETQFAMNGMRIKFTELVAGPLSGAIRGFNDLAAAIIKGEWGKVKKQGEDAVKAVSKAIEVGLPKIADFVANKVMPAIANATAMAAPKIAESFVHGFGQASPAGMAVIGVALLAKMGLTSAVFAAVGAKLGAALAAAISSTGVLTAMATAGTKMGAAIWAGMVRAAPLLAAAAAVYASYQSTKAPGAATPHSEGIIKDLGGFLTGGILGNKSLSPLALGKDAIKALGGATGATVQRGGMLKVGEVGPEIVSLPAAATVTPLQPGSLSREGWGSGDIVIKFGTDTLARVSRRAALESQATGA